MGIYRNPVKLLDYVVAAESAEIKHAFVTFKTAPEKGSIVTTKNFTNNFQLHSEVNANVYHALTDTKLDEYISGAFIRQSQHQEGYWHSYFYPDHNYSTWLFLTLLNKTKSLQDCSEKAYTWLKKTQGANGSWNGGDAYSTALGLECLTTGNFENTNRAVEYLLEQQNPQGNWSTKSVIWEFFDEDGDVWRAFDNNDIIATACCVAALKSFIDYNAKP
jgi:hypothetical protein